MKSKNLVPNWRFPEFKNDEWVEKPMNKLLTIGSGRDYKHLTKGNIPVYGTGGYMLSVNDYLYDGESACIGRKGTINKPVFLTGKFWTVDTLFYTHSFKGCLPKFIYYSFLNINWNNYNEASGVPSLSKTTIGKIDIPIPLEKEEQEQIVSFLNSIDNLISTQKQKLVTLKEHKKALMQTLFPKGDETVPIWRFPEFINDGEWREKSLGEICDYWNGGSHENSLSKDGQYHLISLNSIDIEGNLKEDMKRIDYLDNSLQKNDLVMVLSDVAHGNLLGLSAIIPNDKFVLNQRMAGLRKKKNEKIINEFLRLTINTNQKYFKQHGQGSSQLNLSKASVTDFPVLVPKREEEQQKIANCINSVDNIITIQTKKVEALNQHKKALMQNLFTSGEI